MPGRVDDKLTPSSDFDDCGAENWCVSTCSGKKCVQMFFLLANQIWRFARRKIMGQPGLIILVESTFLIYFRRVLLPPRMKGLIISELQCISKNINQLQRDLVWGPHKLVRDLFRGWETFHLHLGNQSGENWEGRAFFEGRFLPVICQENFPTWLAKQLLGVWHLKIPSGKLRLTMENGPFEDVFPIETGIFHGYVRRHICLIGHTSTHSWWKISACYGRCQSNFQEVPPQPLTSKEI